MTDITSSLKAPSLSKPASAGHTINNESPTLVLVSPEIREAMDLIFPKSSSQFLPRELSVEKETFHGAKASKENMHPHTTSPNSFVDSSSMSCSMSNSQVTTTTTGMSASTEAVTSSFGHELPNVNLKSYVSIDSVSVNQPPSQKKDEGNETEHELKSMLVEKPNKMLAEIRNSKDLETLNSHESSEKACRGGNSKDLSPIECYTIDDSDSEDMRKPFSSVFKEKKIQKRKKANRGVGKCDNLRHDIDSVTKDTSHKTLGTGHKDDSSLIGNSSGSDVVSTQKCNNFKRDTNISQASFTNTSYNYSQAYIPYNVSLENGNCDESAQKQFEHTSRNILHDSFAYPREKLPRQKLPNFKRLCFNIGKHKKKIKNTFPPSFVVLSKLSRPSTRNLVGEFGAASSILPLSVRVKHLSDMCKKGFVNCKKQLVYKNIFEETVVPGVSEDEFENSRGRSLRKRDKNISYVEPSEDDIIDEFSRKRYRSKHQKERSEDEEVGEKKKKKKQKQTDSGSETHSTITSLSCNIESSKLSQIDPIKLTDQSKTQFDNKCKTKKGEKEAVKIAPNEIIVYPPPGFNLQNVYSAKDGRTNNSVEKSNHVSHLLKDKEKNSTVVHPPANVSVLPASTLPGPMTGNANPLMLLPIGFPGNRTGQPLVAVAPSSTGSVTAGTSKPPQFCMVKMDGKDVLLQLVPSNGINLPVPLVTSKGKTLMVPPAPGVQGTGHVIRAPLQQNIVGPITTQAVPTLLTSVVTASQVTTPSTTAPLQSVISVTASQNVSISALPFVQAAQLAGTTNSTGSIRPLNLSTSKTNISNARMTSPVNTVPSTTCGVSLPVIPTTSSILPVQSLTTAAATPMAAPNTTTVVRSVRVPGSHLRAIVPNNSASIRSIRIFVPGCSALGTPGRFATLGTIANSSPLTHLTASSTLLPQRKSTDQDLTPEQRASKRRKLEKKYPLPPGVVIKTEPLETVTSLPSVITTAGATRSLLPQNLHVLSASRTGTGIQSIRIISPSMASALSGGGVRPNTNIIYRAASLGGGQTILVPTSFGISSRTATTVTTTSSTPTASSQLTVATVAVTTATITAITTTNAICTSDTTLSTASTTSLPSPPSLSPVSLPQGIDSISKNTPTSNSCTSIDSSNDSSLSVASVLSSSVPVTTSDTTTSSSSRNSYSLSSNSVTMVTNNSGLRNPDLSLAKAPLEALSLDNVKAAVEELRKIVKLQETRGLKGERLEKLKELLRKKEEQYQDMLQLDSVTSSLFEEDLANCDISGAAAGSEREESTVGMNEHCGSETDPFVID